MWSTDSIDVVAFLSFYTVMLLGKHRNGECFEPQGKEDVGDRHQQSAVNLSILVLASALAGSPDEQIDWFQHIANNVSCPSCGLQMQLLAQSDIRVKRS